MKVVIIEDEDLVAKDLCKILKNTDNEIEILTILKSVKEAKSYFEQNSMPDLIFSDIQLSDGVSFEVFQSNPMNCPIIFTTAYDEYALTAFKFNSIDYLLKPIDETELEEAIAKYKRLKEPDFNEVTKRIQYFLDNIPSGHSQKYKSRFTGHFGKSIVAVTEEQVGYFTIDTIIFLVTLDNKNIITDYHSLDELEQYLNPVNFYRVNRQYIVHFAAIDNVKTHFTGKLTVFLKSPLKGELSISREKSVDFKKWLDGK